MVVKRTSVDLTERAERIKQKHQHLGLKNILSAGLVLFDAQTDAEKLQALADAHTVVDDAAMQSRGRKQRRLTPRPESD